MLPARDTWPGDAMMMGEQTSAADGIECGVNAGSGRANGGHCLEE